MNLLDLDGFKTQLLELTERDVNKIDRLCAFVDHNQYYAELLIEMIYEHFEAASKNEKMAAIHLVNQILITIGGRYVLLIGIKIVNMFLILHQLGNDADRKELARLRSLWEEKQIFQNPKLFKLDSQIRNLAWPFRTYSMKPLRQIREEKTANEEKSKTDDFETKPTTQSRFVWIEKVSGLPRSRRNFLNDLKRMIRIENIVISGDRLKICKTHLDYLTAYVTENENMEELRDEMRTKKISAEQIIFRASRSLLKGVANRKRNEQS